MPRQAKRLNAAFVRKVREPGRYTDGDGLMLVVKPTGAKSWVQRLVIRGRRRDFGLGGFPLVTLAEARETAYENRKLARAGGDPLALRRKAAVPTFREAAAKVVEINRPTWTGERTARDWLSCFDLYVNPKIGGVPVDEIEPADVMRVLLQNVKVETDGRAELVPLWTAKRETGRKVRQRIGTVMKWAVAEGHRKDDPAGDLLTAALPKNGVHRREHHKALPHGDVAGAVSVIRASDAYRGTVLAFEFLVLTATRVGEVRKAEWSEIDFDARTWTVPASRTKTRREHRVPLSRRAVDVLREAETLRRGDLVFPSMQNKAISDGTISKLLRENGVDAVPHGFRSSFRDWCGEMTSAPREVAEAALAHRTGNAVEQAYARSDLYEKRRALMQQWADYIGGERGTVVAFPKGA